MKNAIDVSNVHMLGSDDSEETKADEDKIDQVINSITVHSNNVGEQLVCLKVWFLWLVYSW